MDEETSRLSKELESRWNEFELEELADKIIALEKRVALLNAGVPGREKMMKQVEHFHFRFVFPVALEFDLSRCDKSMPRSFAKTIQYMADRVLKTHSATPFNELNDQQKQEVLQLAAGG